MRRKLGEAWIAKLWCFPISLYYKRVCLFYRPGFYETPQDAVKEFLDVLQIPYGWKDDRYMRPKLPMHEVIFAYGSGERYYIYRELDIGEQARRIKDDSFREYVKKYMGSEYWTIEFKNAWEIRSRKLNRAGSVGGKMRKIEKLINHGSEAI